MRHIWKVKGLYAEWTLTLTATPVNGCTEDQLSPPKIDYKFVGLGKHFSDAVSLYEFLCEKSYPLISGMRPR